MRRTIEMPRDDEREELLRSKSREYYNREWSNTDIDQQLSHKIRIVERLLESGEADYEALKRMAQDVWGAEFDETDFEDAWLVIEDYVLTGGVNTRQVKRTTKFS